jgi:hypothetical protein
MPEAQKGPRLTMRMIQDGDLSKYFSGVELLEAARIREEALLKIQECFPEDKMIALECFYRMHPEVSEDSFIDEIVIEA